MKIRIKTNKTEFEYSDDALASIVSPSTYSEGRKIGDQVICHVIPSILRELAKFERGYK
jgi:hypothetical protein